MHRRAPAHLPGQHAEALLARGHADDVDDRPQHALGPVDQTAGKAGVAEDEPAGGRGQIQTQQRALGAVAVLDGRGAHRDGDEQTESVGDK